MRTISALKRKVGGVVVLVSLSFGSVDAAEGDDKPDKGAAKTAKGDSKPAKKSTAKGSAAKAADDGGLDVAALTKALDSGDDDAISGALEAIAAAKEPTKDLAPAVERLLVRGANAAVTEQAIEAAGKLASESSSAILAPYSRHRAAKIRRLAVKTLLKTKGGAAVKALRSSLRTSDAVVRGTAASGLGGLGAREALSDLFSAFDHGVGEAAASIGQLCDLKTCREFVERLGKFPFDVMAAGLEQILFRSPKDLSDDMKLELVGRLRELGTADVGKFLADVASRWPKDWSVRVKQALEQAAKQTGAASAGGGGDDDEDEEEGE